MAKEAILKAAGVGLAVDPDEARAQPLRPAAVLPPSLGSATEWSVFGVPLAGYVAALACQARAHDIAFESQQPSASSFDR